MDEDQVMTWLQTRLGNLALEHPLVMGAGVAKYVDGPEGIEGFLASANAALLMGGSFTLEPRAGNPGEVCWSSEDGHLTINRMGLPNRGITEITEKLPPVVAQAKRLSRPLGISIAANGESSLDIPTQYATLAQAAFSAGADLVELNLSCPNTECDVVACHQPTVDAIFHRLESSLVSGQHNVCVKVPPYCQSGPLRDMAERVNGSALIQGITTTNTFPNALHLENGVPVISSNEGLAGLSGPCLFPLALGQVAQWRKYLKPEKYIVGGGGVCTVQDVLDMRSVGADAVFLVSRVLTHKPRIFNTLLEGLIEHALHMQ